MPLPLAPLVYGAGALAMRYGPQALRGLQAWIRSPASKQMALQTAKWAPVTFGGDYLADKTGKVLQNSDFENFADIFGIANAARKLNPYQFGTEVVLTGVDPDWERIASKVGRKLSDWTSTIAGARDFTPEPIDLSAQNIPSPIRKDIRLNEPLFANPKGFTNYQLIRGN